jgi:hypothetical protein
MTEMKTSEVLDLAADLIEERGWVQGTGWEGSGALCLEGGIAAAAGTQRWSNGMVNTVALHQCPAYIAVAEHLNRDAVLWQWNDAEGRTAEEVITVLRAASAVASAKEASVEREPVLT